MKNFVGTILLVFSSIICGYGQSTFGDKVAILKVEDADGVLDRSGETMLQSAMARAFSGRSIDCSGTTPKQGSTFLPAEIKTIGERFGADIVVVPSVVKINGSEVLLSAKMVNVKTGVVEIEENVKCNLRDGGNEKRASIFKRGCEDLAGQLARRFSNKIYNNQLSKITFYKGKLYSDEGVLSKKEIQYFLTGEGYANWKQVEDRLNRGHRCLIAGSVLTSLGLGVLTGGVVGLEATEGWPDDDMYRALSIGGVVVGAIVTFSGGLTFCLARSKKAGWKEMEDVFLRGRQYYRVELDFGTQRNGIGFALKF